MQFMAWHVPRELGPEPRELLKSMHDAFGFESMCIGSATDDVVELVIKASAAQVHHWVAGMSA